MRDHCNYCNLNSHKNISIDMQKQPFVNVLHSGIKDLTKFSGKGCLQVFLVKLQAGSENKRTEEV